MLKTRRQRSFWARIKLSIILFQTPRRASDFNNLKQVPFLIFRNVDLEKKEKHTQKAIPSCAFLFSLFFVLRLFSLPKIFALWLFLLSLPFIFKDHYAQSCSYLLQQARNIIYAFRFFCQASFSFFCFFFSSVLKKRLIWCRKQSA